MQTCTPISKIYATPPTRPSHPVSNLQPSSTLDNGLRQKEALYRESRTQPSHIRASLQELQAGRNPFLHFAPSVDPNLAASFQYLVFGEFYLRLDNPDLFFVCVSGMLYW